jgi:hypothetical protein
MLLNGRPKWAAIEKRIRPNTRMQPDRFAREILAISERDTTRSRRLMRHSLGRSYQSVCCHQVRMGQYHFCTKHPICTTTVMEFDESLVHLPQHL